MYGAGPQNNYNMPERTILVYFEFWNRLHQPLVVAEALTSLHDATHNSGNESIDDECSLQ